MGFTTMEQFTVETINAKAEQVAYIGRAMERSGDNRSLAGFMHGAALEKARRIMQEQQAKMVKAAPAPSQTQLAPAGV